MKLPMNKLEARDLLRYCLGPAGSVVPTRHFRDELANEKLTIEDAWHVLQNGRIYDPPEDDTTTGDLKFRIEGHEPGGKWIVVVFCFSNLEEMRLITVFSQRGRRR
jgi:hypothetical protein